MEPHQGSEQGRQPTYEDLEEQLMRSQEQVARLTRELAETTARATQAEEKCAKHDAEQVDQAKAALDLKMALAEFLSQPAATPEPEPSVERVAVDDSWASLEKRVMSLNVPRPEPKTPRSGLRTSMSRRSMGRFGTPLQDPIGAVGEMVAKVARERQARQTDVDPSAPSPVLTPPQPSTKLVSPVKRQPLGDVSSAAGRQLLTPEASPAKNASAIARSPMSSIDSFAARRYDATSADAEAAVLMHSNMLAVHSATEASAATRASSVSPGDDGNETSRTDSSTSSHSVIPALHDTTDTASTMPSPPTCRLSLNRKSPPMALPFGRHKHTTRGAGGRGKDDVPSGVRTRATRRMAA